MIHESLRRRRKKLLLKDSASEIVVTWDHKANLPLQGPMSVLKMWN